MNNVQKYDYFYKIPFYKYSTRLINITNSEGVTVGNMQRTYNNIVDLTIDSILRLANKKNYVVELDDNTEKSYSATFFKYKESFFRDKWNIHTSENGCLKDVGQFINKTKVNTNPRFEYQRKDQKFTFKNDFLEKNIYIEDKDQQVIAIIFYKKITSMRSTV